MSKIKISPGVATVIMVVITMTVALVLYLAVSQSLSNYCDYECKCEKDCQDYGFEFIEAEKNWGNVDCWCWNGEESVQLY